MNFPVKEIAQKLSAINATLAVAESCTGGLLAGALTDFPGASDFFRGGVVTYATETKTDILGISEELIARFGVVSAECAEAMAQTVAEKFHTDFALSTTGIAGPGGGTPKTPVGTVFIGICTPQGLSSVKLNAKGTTRGTVRLEAVALALTTLSELVSKNSSTG